MGQFFTDTQKPVNDFTLPWHWLQSPSLGSNPHISLHPSAGVFPLVHGVINTAPHWGRQWFLCCLASEARYEWLTRNQRKTKGIWGKVPRISHFSISVTLSLPPPPVVLHSRTLSAQILLTFVFVNILEMVDKGRREWCVVLRDAGTSR